MFVEISRYLLSPHASGALTNNGWKMYGVSNPIISAHVIDMIIVTSIPINYPFNLHCGACRVRVYVAIYGDRVIGWSSVFSTGWPTEIRDGLTGRL